MYRTIVTTMSIVSALVSPEPVRSFTPTVTLSGPVGGDLKIHAVPRSIAYKFLKRTHVDYIRRDLAKPILEEVNETRELLRDNKTSDWHVSLVVPTLVNQFLFMIVYRTNKRNPTCYTVEAVLRNHSFEPEEPGMGSMMTTLELEMVLQQLVRSRRGHLQLYPLKSWVNGRYMKELEIEKKYLAETLAPEHSQIDHN